MEILDCGVDEASLTAWKGHFAPGVQPFFVRRRLPLPNDGSARWLEAAAVRAALSPSDHDTFATYDVSRAARHLLLLDEGTFYALPSGLRTALLGEQAEVGRGSVYPLGDLTELLTTSEYELVAATASGGLVVWWPSLFTALSDETQARLLASFVSDDRPPCQRRQLTPQQWQLAQRALPGVGARAGTFPTASGPNCLGAVIEAFTGDPIAGRTERETFEKWLAEHRPSPGTITELGTIILWRDERSVLQHAAVSLGDGYVFHKEAQTWWSPWQVVRLTKVIERWQDAGAMTSIRLARWSRYLQLTRPGP